MNLQNPNNGAMVTTHEHDRVDQVGLPEAFVEKAQAACTALTILEDWRHELFMQGRKLAESAQVQDWDEWCAIEKFKEVREKEFLKAASELVNAIRSKAFMEGLKSRLRECQPTNSPLDEIAKPPTLS